MRAPIHLNHTQQMQLVRKKDVHLWHAGQRQYGPLPFPPLAQSQIEHLQQINFPWCVAAPWLHTDRALSICCLSSQVHGMLSASHHGAHSCGLSKAFTTGYKMDLQTQSQDKTNMLIFIHCPDEKLNLALLTRRARYKTSKDPHPFKSHSILSS